MKKGFLIAYPSEQDIQYAQWLKHFATQLPAYSSRYALTRFQVLQIQCLALDFLDLLVQHTRWATASIQQRQHAAFRLQRAYADQLTADKILLQEKVSQVVGRIQQHPAYSGADADTLQLLPQGQLISGPATAAAPALTPPF